MTLVNIERQYQELYRAISKNNIDKARCLIDSGICLDRTDIYGDTPLDWAVRFDRLEVFELLLKAGAIINISVIISITECDGRFAINMLFLILKSGIDVNIKLEDSETLLMYAAGNGQLENVKVLIALGADVNAISRQAEFALLTAGAQGHQDIFDYLALQTSPSLRKLAAERLPTRFARRLQYFD
jgi:ankyrin repeat protein